MLRVLSRTTSAEGPSSSRMKLTFSRERTEVQGGGRSMSSNAPGIRTITGRGTTARMGEGTREEEEDDGGVPAAGAEEEAPPVAKTGGGDGEFEESTTGAEDARSGRVTTPVNPAASPEPGDDPESEEEEEEDAEDMLTWKKTKGKTKPAGNDLGKWKLERATGQKKQSRGMESEQIEAGLAFYREQNKEDRRTRGGPGWTEPDRLIRRGMGKRCSY